jgi:hypothetical protein
MAKTKTSQVVDLSIFRLNKSGCLTKNSVVEKRWFETTGDQRVLVETRVSSAQPYVVISKDFEGGFLTTQRIPLLSTPCFFGGSRYWFKCMCGRRVGILYYLGDCFICRICGDLAYPLQRATHTGRWKGFYKSLQAINWMQKIEHTRTKFWKGRLTKRCQNRVEKLK